MKTYWCVFDPNGDPYTITIDTEKKYSIGAIENVKGRRRKYLFEEGYTCKEVTINPVEK